MKRKRRGGGGRPKGPAPVAAGYRERENVRRKQKVVCNCAKPSCSGYVSQTTFREHAQWTAARAAEAEERKGVGDLFQGYPAPLHAHGPGLDVQLGLSDGEDAADVDIASDLDDSDVNDREESGVDEDDVAYGPQRIRCSAPQHNTHNNVSV